jgi:titin
MLNLNQILPFNIFTEEEWSYSEEEERVSVSVYREKEREEEGAEVTEYEGKQHKQNGDL